MPSKHVETRITVDASPEQVYAILTDFESYPRWCRQLQLKLGGDERDGVRVGKRVWLRVNPSPVPIPCRLEVTDRGRELRWVGGPVGLLYGSHYFELRPVAGEPDKTEVVHAETFSGLLVPLLWPVMKGQLHRLYEGMNEGLAVRARELAARG